MATNLSSWTKEVAPAAQNAPDFVIERMVLRACRKFCEETNLWKSDLTRISVVADTSDYALTAPTNGEIIKIQSVKYKENGEDDTSFYSLNPASEEEEDRINGGAWEFEESAYPSAFYFDHLTDTLKLYPIPTEASSSGLLVKVIAKPTLTTTSVQDFLYDKYQEVITNGAKGLLLSEVGQPWTDINMGEYHLGKFYSDVYRAKNKKATGFTDKRVRVRQRKFI